MSRTPRFEALEAASPKASAAARGASRKRDTRCELLLRRELWHRGHRYRVDVATLAGRPDILFTRERLAIFCDGDFWHGRDLSARVARLAKGHNPGYWVAKVQRNVERDRRHEITLVNDGWTVLRFWETEIQRDCAAVARQVEATLRRLRAGRSLSGR